MAEETQDSPLPCYNFMLSQQESQSCHGMQLGPVDPYALSMVDP